MVVLVVAFFILGISLYALIHKHRSTESIQSSSPITMELVNGGEGEGGSEIMGPKEHGNAIASFYDISVCEGREKCPTANGEQFDQMGLTFAHKSWDFGTRVQFCHDGRCIVCRGNDRGPYIDGREFDLSLGCAESIGMVQRGVAEVEWKIIL